MTTDQGTGLTIEAVVRAFRDADEQLRLAAERIQGLASHEESTAKAAASLESSAAAVAALASQAGAAVTDLRQSLDVAARTLEAGSALLDDAVLLEIQRRVEETKSSVSDVAEQARGLESKLASSMLDISGAVATSATAINERLDQADSAQRSVAERVTRVGASLSRLTLLGVGLLAMQGAAIVLLLVR